MFGTGGQRPVPGIDVTLRQTCPGCGKGGHFSFLQSGGSGGGKWGLHGKSAPGGFHLGVRRRFPLCIYQHTGYGIISPIRGSSRIPFSDLRLPWPAVAAGNLERPRCHEVSGGIRRRPASFMPRLFQTKPDEVTAGYFSRFWENTMVASLSAGEVFQ